MSCPLPGCLAYERAARGALVVCVSALLGWSSGAVALDGGSPREFFGLLRVRDLTPFGFRRLDMRPSQAAFEPVNQASLEFDLGYQNTWVLSNNVEQYLTRRTQRGPLTEADAAAIRAMPGEAYLVDLELALIDIAFNYKLTDRVSVYGVLAGASYTGGFMDASSKAFTRFSGSAVRPGPSWSAITSTFCST
jgi:hypothetical protein